MPVLLDVSIFVLYLRTGGRLLSVSWRPSARCDLNFFGLALPTSSSSARAPRRKHCRTKRHNSRSSRFCLRTNKPSGRLLHTSCKQGSLSTKYIQNSRVGHHARHRSVPSPLAKLFSAGPATPVAPLAAHWASRGKDIAASTLQAVAG